MEIIDYFKDKTTAYKVAVYIKIPKYAKKENLSFEYKEERYAEFVKKHPLWTLVKFYKDESSQPGQIAFNQLLADCREGKIDLIITYSLCDFSATIEDSLKIADALSSLPTPIGIFFVKENLYTLSPNGMTYFDFFQKIVEQESRNKSRSMADSIFDIINQP